MASAATTPKGDPIEIDRAQLKSARADLVNQEVRLVFALPLNHETLALRQRLAELAMSDEYNAALTIQPLKRSLTLLD